MFISIEGIEGVGKSTVVKYIADYLAQLNIPFILTREPGGTDIAEHIRKILLTANTDEIMEAETELLLMFASRVQHIANVITPALNTGHWVICDRFNDASFAYQGGGRQIDLSHIKMLDNWLVKIHPTVTILLDAPPKVGLIRAKHRGPQDRIEQEKEEFFERVRVAYLARAKEDPARFRVINASQSLQKVQAEIKEILNVFHSRVE